MVLLIWTLIVFIVKYAKEHNATIQNVIDGRPRLLIKNGQLVVIENSDENIRFPLINDGQINMDVLELIHHDEKWIVEQVKKAGFESVNDIYLGEYIHGKLHLVGYPKDN